MKFAMYNHKIISAHLAKGHLLYKCPFCNRRMVYHCATSHHGAYFAHVFTNDSFNNPGETSEHVTGKKQLYYFFKTNNNSVAVEKYLKEINQWPDLMVNRTVIEFQCSPISIKKLKQRIAGYSKLGLKSWWILGSPYQNRHLRSKYIAKFLNYSSHLGFFMLFWKINRSCFDIHYAIREYSGQLNYHIKHIFTYKALINFVHHNQITPRLVSHSTLIKRISYEIRLNQKRLFHGDLQVMWIQQKIGEFHNTIMGCPLICHLPVYTFPIFNKRVLLWRILILLLIDKYSNLQDIYRMAMTKLNMPLVFCQIRGYQSFYKHAFIKYLYLLEEHHYIVISNDGKKITRLKQPRWFNSYYDKLLYLKKHH